MSENKCPDCLELTKHCYSTCPRALLAADSETFWKWWANYSIHRGRGVDPLPLDGAIIFGGGSKSKRRKQPQKKPPVLSVWEGI